MTINFANGSSVPKIPARAGYRCGLAALALLFGCENLQNAVAEGDTRTISFHHIHTNEDLTITYKVNGRYDEEALKKINWELRDWRKEEATKMDPHTIDLLWEVHRELGATEPIWVICGYRSPDTNSMLRRRSSGVAKHSQHMLGKAIDFYIPGVALSALREMGLRAERGGVGFYPESNFVHLDTGNVRHWPRMPEAQLARVLSKGPLTMMASKDRPVRTAAAKMPNPVEALSRLVSGGRDADEEGDVAATSRTPAPAQARTERVPAPMPRPTVVAAVEPKPEKIEKPAIVAAVPMPKPAPKGSKPATFEVAAADSRPVTLSRPMQTASLETRGVDSSDVISARGVWRGAAEPEENTRGIDVRGSKPDPVATGSIAPWPLPDRNATGDVLAYAPATTASVRTASLGPVNVRMTPTAPATTALPPQTTVAVKRVGDKPSVVAQAPMPGQVKAGEAYNDPWLRAMIVSPSAQGFMSTSLIGPVDYRNLGGYLQKPQGAVMMTFSDDPHLGMSSEQFRGNAVVFVATVTFRQRTAALR
jgi:uncharacterized protein YcbK (DUF882 family)